MVRNTEEFDAVEINYNVKPTQPALVLLESIYENPHSNHLYTVPYLQP